LALKELSLVIQKIQMKNPNAFIMVLGDWNVDIDAFQAVMTKYDIPFMRCTVQGSPLTCTSTEKWSAIDHCVASPELANLLYGLKVNRDIPESDHFPIAGYIKCQDAIITPVKKPEVTRMDREAINSSQIEIANHTLWRKLDSVLNKVQDMNEIASRFEETSWAVCRDLKLLLAKVHSTPRKWTNFLSKLALSRRIKKNKAYQIFLQKEAPVRGKQWEKFVKTREEYAAAKRKSHQLSWAKKVKLGVERYQESSSRRFWKWTKQTAGVESMSAPEGPVFLKGCDGKTTGDPAEKLRAWEDYYTNLFSDPNNTSQCKEHWKDKFSELQQPLLDDNDDPISWSELNIALKSAKNKKAVGKDGIVAEFLKAAIEPKEKLGEKPKTILGTILLKIANRLLDDGKIPDRWNESIMCSIYKSIP
jgi:hypothetical protein